MRGHWLPLGFESCEMLGRRRGNTPRVRFQLRTYAVNTSRSDQLVCGATPGGIIFTMLPL